MKTDLLGLVAKMEKKQKKIENIRNDETLSDSFKQDKINEVKKSYDEEVESTFKKLENQLNDSISSNYKKINELQSGDFEKRNYLYNQAAYELSNYDSPADFLDKKRETAADDLELQEARKVALGKARAGDVGNYEKVKESIVETLSDEEYQARKEIAAAEIKKQNLEGAKSSFNYDLKNNDIDLLKTTFTAYSDNSGLDEMAAKKVADTITE